MIKQVILIRRDTVPKMRMGKAVAQGCHGSTAFLINLLLNNEKLSEKHIEWLNSGTRKICLSVPTEKEMLDIYNLAKDSMIESHLVCDSGKTEFKEPTNTCVCLGPDYDEILDKITGHLSLL